MPWIDHPIDRIFSLQYFYNNVFHATLIDIIQSNSFHCRRSCLLKPNKPASSVFARFELHFLFKFGKDGIGENFATFDIDHEAFGFGVFMVGDLGKG